jgi:hypothetical protein
MGCISPRDIPEEEVNLTRTEARLGFGESHAFRHDAIFRKYAVNREMNQSQFNDAASVLGLKVVKKPGLENVEALLSELKVGERFRLNRLLILGLLLGRGEAKEKSNLLFEICDIDATHTIKAVGVARLIRKLFKMSVEVIPKLITPTPKERTYFENLIRVRAKVVEELTKLIFKAESVEMTKERFSEAFVRSELLSALLTSYGFRDYVNKIYKANTSNWFMAPKLQGAQPPSTSAPKSSAAGSSAVPPKSTTEVPPASSAAVPPASSSVAQSASSSAAPQASSSPAPPASSSTAPSASSSTAPPASSSAAPPASSSAVPPASSSAQSSAASSSAPEAQAKKEAESKAAKAST